MSRKCAGVSLVAAVLVSSAAASEAAPRALASRLWAPLAGSSSPAGDAAPAARFRLNVAELDRILHGAPGEEAARRGLAPRVELPLPDGTVRAFRFVDAPVMEPELAASYPRIRTFRAWDESDPGVTVRFDRTPRGLRAMILWPDGAAFVEPEDDRSPGGVYVSRRAEDAMVATLRCLTEDGPRLSPTGDPGLLTAVTPSGANLRTYRLAVAATGEFTQFFGGTVVGALAAIAGVVNNVNGIYQRDVAVRLVLVGTNANVVFTDPATDPFPLANLNAEAQAAIDAGIGDANYDIGHLFHAAGFSGNAGCIGCICSSGSKGSGFSQDGTPGDADFTFLVAHEMGHQHGGTHTFNGSNCNASQYTASSAWEPGSGSTIMSYSSICGADNVLGSQVGDLYFHAGNRQQIVAFTTSGGGSSCGTSAATGNAVPTVSAGPDRTIPRGTPFTLTASGADADGGTLTYTWEQLDLGPAAALNALDDGQIPLFRSRPPTTSASRTFPRLQDILAGNLFPSTLGEQLPSLDRTLTFRTSVRDNQGPTGGANDDDLVLTVAGAPFAVTGPTAASPLECGVANTVTWAVGGGSVAPTVDIRLSLNDGASFPTLLAAGTPNDGSQGVPVPAGSVTPNGRVRIDAVGNVFFNVSERTPVRDTLSPAVGCPAAATVECSATGGTPYGDPQLAPFLGGASAADACDASPSLTDDAPGLLPLGATPVTFTAKDASNNTASCASTVTVQDTTAPSILCPADAVVECTGNNGILKTDPQLAPFFAGASAADVCDAAPSIADDAPPFLPLGSTPVTFTATDGSANASSCGANVGVVDTLPPAISVTVRPEVLWPPSHKMAPISATVSVLDVCDPAPTFELVSITSNEPDNGLGDGDTPNDIQGAAFGTPDTSFFLRAERSGLGSGRVYTILYRARDGSGNTSLASAEVRVPHSQRP
jgi:hypothetical protein